MRQTGEETAFAIGSGGARTPTITCTNMYGNIGNVFVVQVDEKMQVLTKEGGEVVPNLYCIGDANGKLMLAHAASAHGVRCATRYSHTVRRVVPRVFRVSWIAFGCPGRVT